MRNRDTITISLSCWRREDGIGLICVVLADTTSCGIAIEHRMVNSAVRFPFFCLVLSSFLSLIVTILHPRLCLLPHVTFVSPALSRCPLKDKTIIHICHTAACHTFYLYSQDKCMFEGPCPMEMNQSEFGECKMWLSTFWPFLKNLQHYTKTVQVHAVPSCINNCNNI